MPNARASWATCPPMRPSPTIPIVLPRSSVPSNRLRSHSPRRIASAAHGMCRTSASSSPIACSAALTVFAPGAFITAIPRRVAAGTSMLSTPVPAHGMVAHVTDPDRRLLEGPVPRADRPARVLERADDGLRAPGLRHLEARDGPAASLRPRQERHAALLAPRLHARAHRVVPSPARLDTPLALDAPELRLECVEQRDRRRVGGLVLDGRLGEAHEVEVQTAVGQRPGALQHALGGDAQREPRWQGERLR